MEFQCEYLCGEERRPSHEGIFSTIIESMEEDTELKGIKDTSEDCYLIGNVELKEKPGLDGMTIDAMFICKQFAIIIDFEDAQNYVTGKANVPGQTPAQWTDNCQAQLLKRIATWNSYKNGNNGGNPITADHTAGIIVFTNCAKDMPLPEAGCKSDTTTILRSRDTKFAHTFWTLTCHSNESKGQKSFWDRPQEEWLFSSDEDLREFLKNEGISLKCWQPKDAAAPLQDKETGKVTVPELQTPASAPHSAVARTTTHSTTHTAPSTATTSSTFSPKPSTHTKPLNLTRYLIFAGCAVVALLVLFLGPKACQEKQGKSEKNLTQDIPLDLSGSYFVEEIYGAEGAGQSAVVRTDTTRTDAYYLHVFSSALTEHFSFTHNPKTHELSSEELGKGKVYTHKLTKETIIQFEGWKLKH